MVPEDGMQVPITLKVFLCMTSHLTLKVILVKNSVLLLSNLISWIQANCSVRYIGQDVCMYACIHTYIHTYVCTYTRTYIYTYIHTYVHT